MSVRPKGRGLTVVEIVVALTVSGMILTLAGSVLHRHRQAHRRQVAAVNMNNTLRVGIGVVRAELLELSAGDVDGGDILAMASDSLVYRAHRGLFFLCQPPDTITHAITLFQDDSLRFPSHGWPLTPSTDSLFIYAEADQASDGRWLRRALLATSVGAACPGGASSLTVSLSGPPIVGVVQGAPVRATQVWKLKSYRDARGDWWLGAQRIPAAGAAAVVQPVVGPLNGPDGLRLEYYDADGTPTTDPDAVDRVSVTIVSRSGTRVVGWSGLAYAVDSLTTEFVARNNPNE